MINSFIKKVEDSGLCVNSIIITQNGQTESRILTSDTPCNIRSISKVISCLGVCKAIEAGLFEMESFVLPFFSDIRIKEKNLSFLQNKLKIKHLLNLTMGHEFGMMFSKEIKALPVDTDWIERIFNYDILHNPGEFFVYNNANAYILSSIVQRITGKNFSEWVSETVLSHLGIKNYTWENSAQGICLGASGMHLCNSDLHKIALLLLRKGMIESGKQLIPASWISEMAKPKFITATLPEYASKQGRCLNKMAYGLSLWICGDGSKRYPKNFYFCDGTDGQFLIILPEKEIAITILSKQKDMNPFYEIFNDFI